MCVSLLTPTRTESSSSKSKMEEKRAGSNRCPGKRGGRPFASGAFTPGSNGGVSEMRGRFPAGSLGLDICAHNNRTLRRNKTSEPRSPRRGGLGSVPFEPWSGLFCGENTTDPATGTKSLGVFCLETLFNMDSMVR